MGEERSAAWTEMERMRNERDKAKTEIEERTDLAREYMQPLRESREKMRKERDEARAEVEGLREHAKIGGLVLGMRPQTRFTKGNNFYWTETREADGVAWDYGLVGNVPAEALAAIQEEESEAE